MSTIPPNGLPTVLTPSSGGSTTILSQNKKSDIGTLTLLSGMAETNQKLMQKKIAEVSSRYDYQESSAKTESANWKSVARKIGDAASFLSETTGRVKAMLSQVEGLMSTVNKADQSADKIADPNYDMYATGFDSMLRGLIDKAEDGRVGKLNLLSRGEPTYSYQISTTLQTAWVQGGYMGSEYSIVDDNGNRWKPDRNARLLRQYDGTTGEELQAVSMRSGLEVISHNTSTGALKFAINADTANRFEFNNAKITRDGLKLMDSWLYGGLSTESGRQAALKDLSAARATLKLEASRYESARVMSAYYESRANAHAADSKDKANEAVLERAKAVKKVQEDFTRQFENTRNQVLGAMQIRQKFLEMFGQSKLTKTLIDFHT